MDIKSQFQQFIENNNQKYFCWGDYNFKVNGDYLDFDEDLYVRESNNIETLPDFFDGLVFYDFRFCLIFYIDIPKYRIHKFKVYNPEFISKCCELIFNINNIEDYIEKIKKIPFENNIKIENDLVKFYQKYFALPPK